jgi:hypothetical protein
LADSGKSDAGVRAPVEAIKRMQKVWEVFSLKTPASVTKALGRLLP